MNKFIRTADDLVRVAANGVTFGLPDYLEGGDAAAKTAASRERLGFAGDVTNAGSMLLGAGKVIKGAGYALKGVRAIPGVVSQAAAAARPFVHPGITRAETLARLGIAAEPSMLARAGASILAHPVKSAIYGLGTVGTAFASHARRDDQARAAAPAVKPAAKPDARKQPASAAAEAQSGPSSPFEAMIAQVAKAQGGKISLGQMAALSDMAYKTTPRTSRAPTGKDVAAANLSRLADQVFEQAQIEAQQLKAAGRGDEAQEMWNNAVRERQLADRYILSGADPSMAELMAQQDDGD